MGSDDLSITIVGGGPAGLYFALLMKKSNPDRRVLVLERNGPDDTFGWGVVFSDKTLSYLRESDYDSYLEITNSFETWDNVDVVHRSHKITIRGNKFSGIARIKLLHILQNRCLSLGVDLRFRTEIGDLEVYARESGLLVGADGINSVLRQSYGDYFQPSLSLGHNKYIWYGTRRLFHGLTLTFRETEHGVFAAHSYKFDKSSSTFIVECPEETWTSAGLERMPDRETREYIAAVFAPDLAGQPLLSNNSKWINFVNVKNEHWSYHNMVLLGDALHTAHFSIGSGTKLALEDAIALSKCLSEKKILPEALAEFERVRRPVIEEYQEAAYESLIWFENVKDYMHLDPLRFAYALMTRSKKIDFDNLKKRDPEFIAAYEAANATPDGSQGR
jgi:anthraniloyl-CoA monooxygenase